MQVMLVDKFRLEVASWSRYGWTGRQATDYWRTVEKQEAVKASEVKIEKSLEQLSVLDYWQRYELRERYERRKTEAERLAAPKEERLCFEHNELKRELSKLERLTDAVDFRLELPSLYERAKADDVANPSLLGFGQYIDALVKLCT